MPRPTATPGLPVRFPIDKRLRQVKIGNWPAMSVHAAVVEWEKLCALRDIGIDPAEQRRQSRQAQQLELAEQKASAARRAYTVLDVCTDYPTPKLCCWSSSIG